jgi:hypothetical protein
MLKICQYVAERGCGIGAKVSDGVAEWEVQLLTYQYLTYQATGKEDNNIRIHLLRTNELNGDYIGHIIGGHDLYTLSSGKSYTIVSPMYEIW